MAYTRKNVWAQGGSWDDETILWYARGVKAMKARALNDLKGWRFFGAIHGFNQAMWQQVGYLSQSDEMPKPDIVSTFWAQCQHGSWFFLPWHRGYLMAFEQMIRDAIGSAGPADWALPYWDYFQPNQNDLPPAFASPDWPDGKGDNPLYVTQRYGPSDDGNIYVPVDVINQKALGDPDFIGPGKGGSQGFGGVQTKFSHGGGTHGGIETQPHDQVHGLVGGGTRQQLGLMSWPDLAGLDPIFWVHHANVDRLWEVWNRLPTSKGDPNQPNWLKGPASVGERSFVMPKPDGANWTYTPDDMQDLSKLSYSYDDVSPPSGLPQPIERLQRLGLNLKAAQDVVGRTAVTENVELLGALDKSLNLTGADAVATLALDAGVKNKVAASLLSANLAKATAAPDRVFLNLENVRGLNDATVVKVYINVPDGDDPAKHPELLAGSVALFGVSNASLADGEHAGNGLTFVLEITHIVDALHLSGALAANRLHVRLVPLRPVAADDKISIGRISVFRQGT
jgi:tyrosinase